jgi:hypothetical protein
MNGKGRYHSASKKVAAANCRVEKVAAVTCDPAWRGLFWQDMIYWK